MFDLLESVGALSSTVPMTGDNTLLHWFCYRAQNDEKTSLLEKLLKKGFDVNAQNLQQRTPLMVAVRNDMTRTCRILLQHNANIDLRDYNGNQAIDLSVAGSECSKILLHTTRTEKFKLQLKKNSADKPRNTFIRRQRIDLLRRRTIELSEINGKGADRVSKSSVEGADSLGSPRSSIYPDGSSNNDDSSYSHERAWESPSKPKRSSWLFRKLAHERAHSMDGSESARL